MEKNVYQPGVWSRWDRVRAEAANRNIRETGRCLEGLEQRKAEMVVGSYVGDGAENQFINLGFAPKAVLAISNQGSVSAYGGLCLPGHDVSESHGQLVMSITEGGFTAHGGGSGWSKGNQNGTVMLYAAFRSVT